MSKIDKEEVLQLYFDEGLTAKEVAERLGVRQDYIYQLAMRDPRQKERQVHHSSFSDWVKSRMELQGLSQADLAEKSGLYDQRISEICRGVVDPRLSWVRAICNVLGPFTVAMNPDGSSDD